VTTLSVNLPRAMGHYAQGWATSVLLHGLVFALAILLFSDLKLAPQPEPFKWDVAMVQESKPTPVESPAPPTPPRRETPPPQQPVRQVETQPVVQTVHPVERIVRQEVREVRPIAQPTITRVSQQTHAVPVVNETVAIPNEQPQAKPMVHETAEAQPTSLAEASPPSPSEPAPLSKPVVETASPASVVQDQVFRQETVVAKAAPAPQEAPIKNPPVQTRAATRPDYSWLAEALWSRVERLKRYPHMARMNRWEGKVVLQAVVRENGELLELKVAESSGYAVLDQEALEVLRRASPLSLKHPLGQPQVVIQVPISYRLAH
jgi:protein TonB